MTNKRKANPTRVEQTWTHKASRMEQVLIYFVSRRTGKHVISFTGAMADPLDFWVYDTIELARASWLRRINCWRAAGFSLTATERPCHA